MTASTSQPAPQPDTFDEAISRAQRDFARLLHYHSPSWELNLSGEVAWRCTCSLGTRRVGQAMDAHIKDVVRKERGPTRPPNTQTKRY